MSSGNVIETSTHALVVFFSRAGENYCATYSLSPYCYLK